MRGGTGTLNESLARLHGEVREYFPFVVRIAVALYDAPTGEIRTFLNSPHEASPLSDYRIPLTQAGWLDELRRSRRSRAIDVLEPATVGYQEHSTRIVGAGYRASYTVPVYDGARFVGFVFFDSNVRASFTPRVVRQLDLFVRIVGLVIRSALRSVDVLVGGLSVLREISAFRDAETAGHLARMASYAECIARRVAPELGRDDEWVEQVLLFAPLHDIGKIAIPDAVLLKSGRHTPGEQEIMRTHAERGERILSTLIDHLELGDLRYVDMLRHIARHHHERWDGHGYPDGLAGEGIPVEARIVRVADVFDALTTRRCYKAAWPVEAAQSYLREHAGSEFDPRLVAAFLESPRAIEDIMERFTEESTEAT
jgi:HD-GYP domain-containing protein (c-di-GMP phosphodiesterase class II)